jgi:hypothetical protein
MIIEHHPSHLN